MNKEVVVYPGRFDPLTLGHMDIINRASTLFPNVVVAVASCSDKSRLWTLEKRISVIQKACQSIANIQVIGFDGLLAEWVAEHGWYYIIRGIRDSVDMSVEWRMAHNNRVLNPQLETLFLASSPEVSHISSTLVRDIIASQGDLQTFVPPAVLDQFS